MIPIHSVKRGDIVREVATNRERVVYDCRPDMGLLAFENSHLEGWTPMDGYIPTGKTAEVK